MNYHVSLFFDSEASVWVATSEDVPGLALESDSFDTLVERVSIAIPELLELNGMPAGKSVTYHAEEFQRNYA